ncbi:hypothetical protein PACTADRAFT_33351 [Pachysolen tannophilus NRRL Y-2460]|uniref:Ubiquitin carboxyl-terminal hydrolase n=1 Tax=Pachysolen tannophilus NRRL Y-2460 TaxID=669874 RepID=A0A1E4TWN6_PACTA|nr:hypothetical protein PACTADRAFT_33351 [Pachysolen tannophilus NRRL Y-2460]
MSKEVLDEEEEYPASVVPLESNPEIFTEFAHKLGLSPLLSFYDIYSLTDQDLLQILPQPIYSIILLFPISSKYEEEKLVQDKELSAPLYEKDAKNDCYWFEQKTKNACGFFALLHVLINLPSSLINLNSLIDLFKKNLIQDFKQRDNLVKNLIFNSNQCIYQDYSNKGQTITPDANDDVNLHFICFMKNYNNGNLYELDGRRRNFLKLGKSINETGTQEDKNIINEKLIVDKILHYMDIADDEDKYKFSMIGLGPTFD